MVKKAEQMRHELKKRMRGGDGTVELVHILEGGEYKGKARLFAKIILQPGCSIGAHIHEGEEEIFYLLRGEASFMDGETEKRLLPGDAAVTLGGEGHSIANRGQETVELVAVILTY